MNRRRDELPELSGHVPEFARIIIIVPVRRGHQMPGSWPSVRGFYKPRPNRRLFPAHDGTCRRRVQHRRIQNLGRRRPRRRIGDCQCATIRSFSVISRGARLENAKGKAIEFCEYQGDEERENGFWSWLLRKGQALATALLRQSSSERESLKRARARLVETATCCVQLAISGHSSRT